MTNNVIQMKGTRHADGGDGMVPAKMDTLCLTRAAVMAIEMPPFQRALRVNDKVREIAGIMKTNGGVIDGVLTIGILNGHRYWVDGQHRKEGFLLSELKECYADVRMMEFETMADMAEEYVRMNSRIVSMKPDDVLKGLELSIHGLSIIRRECPFIGYDQIRRGPSAPLLSMTVAIRNWIAGQNEVPTATGRGSALNMAKSLTDENALACSRFYRVAHEAWGGDKEYQRLWGSLNLAMCAWLWNNMVLKNYSQKSSRLTAEQFKQAMMSLSANSHYLDWLVGRENREQDRAPCYTRIKGIIHGRLQPVIGKKIFYPSPAWVHHAGATFYKRPN